MHRSLVQRPGCDPTLDRSVVDVFGGGRDLEARGFQDALETPIISPYSLCLQQMILKRQICNAPILLLHLRNAHLLKEQAQYLLETL